MKIDKKQFLSALMAVGLGGAAMACGGDPEATEETSAPPPTSGAENRTPPPPVDTMNSMEEDQGMEDNGIAPTAE